MARNESGFSFRTAVDRPRSRSASSVSGKMNMPPSTSASTAWLRDPVAASAAEANQIAPETNEPTAPFT